MSFLSTQFLQSYAPRTVKWGFSSGPNFLGELVYRRTYRRNKETWRHTLERVVEGEFELIERHHIDNGIPFDAERYRPLAEDTYERFFTFKALPPGRGLWLMGTDFARTRGAAGLSNCLAHDTEIITRDGTRKIGEVAGTTQTLLTKGGVWVDAPIRSFGVQRVYKITLSRQGDEKVIYATAGHRWFVKDSRKAMRDLGFQELTTSELLPGFHRLQYVFGQGLKNTKPSPFGIAHGVAFGDGSTTLGEGNANSLVLCGEKKRELLRYFHGCPVTESQHGLRISNLPNAFKKRPDIHENKGYLFGWLAGYFSADGSVSKSGQATISSVDLENLKFVRDVCYVLGIGTYSINSEERVSNLTNRPHKMYRLCLMRDTLNEQFFLLEEHRKRFQENQEAVVRHWNIDSVEDTGEEQEVFCATVDGYGCFSLADNILTGNCGFVSTKHLHTDLSLPFRFLMDMSMLGVGVGFDTRGANTIRWEPRSDRAPTWEISDDREGWVESTCRILDWGMGKGSRPSYKYDSIRPAGMPIKGFGGTASGPEPLIVLHEALYELIERRKGEKVSTRDIVDIGNLQGVCVVAGNVRRCLPKGTLVHTDKGLVRIEDAKPGMMAKTASGFSRIGELVEQGVQKVWGVRTQMGEFRCTAKHLMAVMTAPGKYEWVRANELKPGDRLVFVEGGVDGEQTQLPSWNYERPEHSTTCKDISIPPLDTESSWFLGMFHGNGYTRPNFEENGFNAYVSIATDARNEAIIERCQKGMARFGVNLCDVLPSEEDKSHKIRCQSKQLAWYLAKFKTAHESMEVPECVLRGTREVRAAYVAGLYDADGTTSNRPVLLVSSVYPKYLAQVQAVYASLGIPTRIESKRKARGEWKELFALTCVGELAIVRFESVVASHSSRWQERDAKTSRSQNDYGFPSAMVDVPYGRNWSPNNRQMTVATYERCGGNLQGLVPVEVLEVVPDVDEVETYDITVPEAKEFVCQEGLLVHNTAEIVFGEPDDEEYLDLKDYAKNPDRGAFGWVSNNTVSARVGMNYEPCARRTGVNGEPGYKWLENMRAYSRMKDAPDWKDYKADGGNPCLEQTLESFELCNLSTTYPYHHESLDDFRASLSSAWLYTKAVTLAMTHWERTNEIIRRNRRVGSSLSGIVQAVDRLGEDEFRRWCDTGFHHILGEDERVSRDWRIPTSIKHTSVKPDGTTGLVAGATPGCHWPTMTTYIRRVRYAAGHPDVQPLRDAGYNVEPSIVGYEDYATKSGPIYDPRTVVVEIPVDISSFGIPQEREVPLRRKVELAVLLQEEYADNQVSCTASFLPHEATQIAPLLTEFDSKLKGISFLPIKDEAYYPQMPYEAISREEYERLVSGLGVVQWSDEDTHMEEERGCDGGACEIKAAA